MANKRLRHTLAGLSIAGLVAGAGLAMPGSSFGSSGCGGASGCGGGKSNMSGCGGASGTPPSTIPMEDMKEGMTPPETPEDQKNPATEAQPPAETTPAPEVIQPNQEPEK